MAGNVFRSGSIKLLLFFILSLNMNAAYSDNMIIDNIKNSENSSAERKYCENR